MAMTITLPLTLPSSSRVRIGALENNTQGFSVDYAMPKTMDRPAYW